MTNNRLRQQTSRLVDMSSSNIRVVAAIAETQDVVSETLEQYGQNINCLTSKKHEIVLGN